MDPVTWLVAGLVAAGVLAGGGFAGGYVTGAGAGGARSVEALAESQAAFAAEHGEAIEALQAHVDTLAESDALVADRLTSMPPPCLPELGGDPMSPECAWALCLRTGQSDAQRCEVGDLTDLLVERWRAKSSCPDGP